MDTVWVVFLNQERDDFYPMAVFSSREAALAYAQSNPDTMDLQAFPVDAPFPGLMRQHHPQRVAMPPTNWVIPLGALTTYDA
jgi:hypothetical protein